MLYTMPDRESWHRHMQDRLHQGFEIGLINWRSAVRPMVVAPPDLSIEALAASEPYTSLRDLTQAFRPHVGWSPRPDLYDEAAHDIFSLSGYSPDRRTFAFAEAAHLKYSDPVVRDTTYVVSNDVVILTTNLGYADSAAFSMFLRKARSWRLLGALQFIPTQSKPDLPLSGGVFFCDALDNDSLIFDVRPTDQ